MLRVIQLFNQGGYHCDDASTDGFETGNGKRSCVPHSADYMNGDFRIELRELLRVIQLMNANGGRYRADNASEDGFNPDFTAE